MSLKFSVWWTTVNKLITQLYFLCEEEYHEGKLTTPHHVGLLDSCAWSNYIFTHFIQHFWWKQQREPVRHSNLVEVWGYRCLRDGDSSIIIWAPRKNNPVLLCNMAEPGQCLPKFVKWASDSKSHYVQHLHKYTGNPDKYINKYECCIWQSHGVWEYYCVFGLLLEAPCTAGLWVSIWLFHSIEQDWMWGLMIRNAI